jgi:hypothetical protein
MAVAHFFLVRPMSIPLRLAIVLGSAMSLTSCVTPPVIGPASASISDSDIREIKFLVAQRRDIRQGVLKIWAERPDRAVIESGSQSYNGAEYSHFIVIKAHGRWQVSSRIERRHVYATG